MNKQELIEIMESLIMKHSDEGEYPHIATYNAYVNSLGWIRKLDEPQKPVVPKFVADLVDWTNKMRCAPSDVIQDFQKNGNLANLPRDLDLDRLSEHFEKAYCRYDFEKACFVGYEIEKESIYEVVFLDDGYDRYLLMKLDEKSYEIVPESENDGYRTQYFTEKQIKTINERYWLFAVPADEVAEG